MFKELAKLNLFTNQAVIRPRRPLAVLSLAALAVSSLLLVNATPNLSFNHSGQKHYVDITTSGFSPNDLTITGGDTVVFRNKTIDPAWPASDPHPTHEYLNGFDPQGPVSPNKEWSYTFSKTGTWRYHDHLHISVLGTINVIDNTTGTIGKYKAVAENCDGQCFDNLISQVVQNNGIDAAYDLFDAVYAGGKLPRTCHWTAHRIGEAAYQLYKNHSLFKVTTKTSYCGYGFYHGFLEKLLRDTGDINYALKFCDQVHDQLGQMGLYNCIHGIGHGYTEDPPDPSVLGKPDDMLRPGIATCEKLFGKKFSDLNLCLTGVFTVVAGFFDQNQYGLKWTDNDPFSFCRTQPYRYQKACYGEFAPKLDHRLNWDLSKIPAILNKVHDNKSARLIVWVLPSVFVSKDILKTNFDSYIDGCRGAFSDDQFRKICWAGTMLGFYSHGEPNKQYLKVVGFCSSDHFSESEKKFCFDEGLRQARQTYSSELMNIVCQAVPNNYRGYCAPNNDVPPYDDPEFE